MGIIAKLCHMNHVTGLQYIHRHKQKSLLLYFSKFNKSLLSQEVKMWQNLWNYHPTLSYVQKL